MNECPRCGADITKAARFCRSCGADLESTEPSTAKPAAGAKGLPALGPTPTALVVADPETARDATRRRRLPWIIAIASLTAALAIAAVALIAVLGHSSPREGKLERQASATKPTSTTSTSSTTSTTVATVATTTTTTAPVAPEPPTTEMQAVVDSVLRAEVAHDWATLRQQYPLFANKSDDDLNTGYATTTDQTATPRTVPVQVGPTAWSANYFMVAHDSGAQDKTSAFCEYWTVDVGAQIVTLSRGRQGTRLGTWDGWLSPAAVESSITKPC